MARDVGAGQTTGQTALPGGRHYISRRIVEDHGGTVGHRYKAPTVVFEFTVAGKA